MIATVFYDSNFGIILLSRPGPRLDTDSLSKMDEKNQKDVTLTVSSQNEDTFLVAFTKPFDAENPQDWPALKKWMQTSVLSATGFNRIMVSTIMAPALTIMVRKTLPLYALDYGWLKTMHSCFWMLYFKYLELE